MVHQAPVGFDPETCTGPLLTFLSFAMHLLPLAVLELYFLAQQCGGAWVRLGVAALLGGLTVATAAGIVGASLML